MVTSMSLAWIANRSGTSDIFESKAATAKPATAEAPVVTTFDPPNKVFVTSTTVIPGTLGGLAGADAVTWPAGEEITVGRDAGEPFLQRQALCLAGGSNEIQRNIIAERVLGMPREWAADRDVPFRDVRRNAMPTAPSGA